MLSLFYLLTFVRLHLADLLRLEGRGGGHPNTGALRRETVAPHADHKRQGF